MGFISNVFRYELKRLLIDKKQLIFWLGFLLISLYSINVGVSDYQRVLVSEKQSGDYEAKKLTKYVNYNQYAGYGFRIFLKPSPLMIIFNGHSALDDVVSNVDSREEVKLFHSYKGRDLFLNRGKNKYFSEVVYLLGSLFMLYAGIGSFNSLKEVKFLIERKGWNRYFFSTIFVRTVIISISFTFNFVVLYFYIYWQNIGLGFQHFKILLIYSLYTILFLSIFFFMGVLLKVLVDFRGYVYGAGILVWFCFIYVAPEIQRSYLFNQSLKLPANSEIDLQKLSNLMAFEKSYLSKKKAFKELRSEKQKLDAYKRAAKDFMSNYYLLSKNVELTLYREVEKLIKNNEIMAVFLPSCYYNLIAGEFSSKGYKSYLDFMKYIIELREQFLEYYIEKGVGQPNKPVESFVKNEENIYKPEVTIPSKIFWSVWFILLYIFLLIHVTYIRLKKKVYR